MDQYLNLQSITIFKDLSLAFAAITTSIVAILGFNRWRAEHKGKANFDAAKVLLAAIYSVRNNFELARSEWIDASEFPEDYLIKVHQSFDKPNDMDKANATWHVYKNRLEPLVNSLIELDTALIQGEAIWGPDVKNHGRKIRGSFHRLVRSIKHLVGEESRGTADSHHETLIRYRKDIAASRESEDELSKQIRGSVEYFESVLAPYVRAK